MNKVFTIFCFIVFLYTPGIYAQQLPSPLESSFQTYKEMKKDTKYKLDWVSLGPVVNSARADVVQADATHPGTMYVGFGSGGLWKTVNNGISWTVFSRSRLHWVLVIWNWHHLIQILFISELVKI